MEIKNIANDAPAPEPAQLYPAKDIIRAKVKTYGVIDDKRNLTTIDTTTNLEDKAVSANDYPKYEKIFNENQKGDFTEIRLNGKYLADIAEALSKLDPFQAIIMRVPHTPMNPILFIASGNEHTARALLSPMTNS
ncbi:MAG: hypothetical protein ACYDAK_13260 [Candidatus Limnocylindrales bacterium]